MKDCTPGNFHVLKTYLPFGAYAQILAFPVSNKFIMIVYSDVCFKHFTRSLIGNQYRFSTLCPAYYQNINRLAASLSALRATQGVCEGGGPVILIWTLQWNGWTNMFLSGLETTVNLSGSPAVNSIILHRTLAPVLYLFLVIYIRIQDKLLMAKQNGFGSRQEGKKKNVLIL